MLIWIIASLWILQSPTQLSSELIERDVISATITSCTNPGLLFYVASNFTQTHTLAGVSMLTLNEFACLWCAQVCWLGHSPYKGILTWLGGFLWNPLHQERGPPQLILSDALLAVIGKTIKRTLADKKALPDARNKAHLYWPLSDLYECLKMALIRDRGKPVCSWHTQLSMNSPQRPR